MNAGDVAKDHKGVLLPVAALLIIAAVMSVYYDRGGSFVDIGEEFGNKTTVKTSTSETKSYSAPPEMQLLPDVDYTATIVTSMGDIDIDLFEDRAPRTVNNFVFLAEKGFYDDLTFHRVISGFVIQGGDPEGTGTGGPGYRFNDEINPLSLGLDSVLVRDAPFLEGLYSTWDASTVGYAPNSLRKYADESLADFYDLVIGFDYEYGLQSYPFEPGVLAMANSGPNTNGSQFFITVSGSDTTSLNGRYTVFGKVTKGMSVVDEIAEVNVDSANKPVRTVTIERIVINRS